MRMDDKMQKIVSLAKRKGFVFPSSEIYGGIESVWDYGPLGALMRENIRREWRKRFIQQKDNIVPIEGMVLMNSKVWETSGHVENFTDPLFECKNCNGRLREDHMKEGSFVGQGKATEKNQCPTCGGKEFTEPRNFELMFKTFLGPVEDEANVAYLRPETAQSMFTNFKLVQESQRLKVPFGIAQVGKAFRNEITTGNFIFRLRELEIMEIEYFVKPGEDEKVFDEWVQEWFQFYLDMGLSQKNLRLYEHPKEGLAHYSKRTVDIEYKFPFGWGELSGVANRTDFDLKAHSEASGQDLRYRDEETGESYFPYVIEPTMGVDRLMLALLVEGYEEIEGARTTTTEAVKESEVVLKLNPKVAPVQVVVYPLIKNKPELVAKAKEVYDTLKAQFMTQYDESGSIGRRYRRADEIGVPLAVTVDFKTMDEGMVTVRDRDTMKQETIQVSELIRYITDKLNV